MAGFLTSSQQASVPEEMGSVSASFIAMGQTSGITISLAIANALFVNGAQDRLAAILPASVGPDQIQGAIAGLGTGFVQDLSPELQTAVLEAIVEAMRRPYILVITAGALVLVLSLFMKRERLFMAAGGPGA